jgi:hypothetical protein
MVRFIIVVHAVRRSGYVWALAVAPIRYSAPLVVLAESLVRGGVVACLLLWCPIIFLPILRWSTSIRINVVHEFGVAALAFIVARSRGFICLRLFSAAHACESVESQTC